MGQDSSIDKNKEIENEIESYLLEPKTDYAIMLVGGWGKGKTYFLKKRVFRLIKKCWIIDESIDKKRGYRPVYISLNGVSDVVSLKSLMEKKIDLFIRTNDPHSAINQARRLDNMVQRDPYGDDRLFLDRDNVVLCFDDLERIGSGFLEEALGYINTYVEHDGVKTIFISSESRIVSENYKSIKEKYIRQTFELGSQINNVINDSEHTDIAKNREAIQEIFLKKQSVNLRTWFCAEFYIKKVLSVVYSIQEKQTFNHLDKIKEEIIHIICEEVIVLRESGDFEQSYYNSDFYPFLKYIRGRCLIETMRRGLVPYMQYVANVEDNKLAQLRLAMVENPYGYDDASFREEVSEMVKEVGDGLFDLGTCLKLFRELVSLESCGVSQLIDTKEFESAIERAKSAGKLKPLLSTDPYIVFRGEDEYQNKFNRISAYIDEVNKSLQEIKIEDKKNEMFSLLQQSNTELDADKLRSILCAKGRFYFVESDADRIFNYLETNSGSNRYIVYIVLLNRYENADGLSPTSEQLKDSRFIISLQKLTKEYIDNKQSTNNMALKDVPIFLLGNMLEKILKQYELEERLKERES